MDARTQHPPRFYRRLVHIVDDMGGEFTGLDLGCAVHLAGKVIGDDLLGQGFLIAGGD